MKLIFPWTIEEFIITPRKYYHDPPYDVLPKRVPNRLGPKRLPNWFGIPWYAGEIGQDDYWMKPNSQHMSFVHPTAYMHVDQSDLRKPIAIKISFSAAPFLFWCVFLGGAGAAVAVIFSSLATNLSYGNSMLEIRTDDGNFAVPMLPWGVLFYSMFALGIAFIQLSGLSQAWAKTRALVMELKDILEAP